MLTGMGSDGLRGCQAIRESKGHIMVQDKATSVIWGMPGYVAQEGLAEHILPIGKIAQAIRDCVESTRNKNRSFDNRKSAEATV